jgi:negative regulator of sigma E activity
MDKIDYKELEKIPVPEDLEERLSMQIDMWEKQEKAARKHNIILSRILPVTGIAACLAAVVLLGIREHNNDIRKTDEAMDLLFYAFELGSQNTDDAIDFLF